MSLRGGNLPWQSRNRKVQNTIRHSELCEKSREKVQRVEFWDCRVSLAMTRSIGLGYITKKISVILSGVIAKSKDPFNAVKPILYILDIMKRFLDKFRMTKL